MYLTMFVDIFIYFQYVYAHAVGYTHAARSFAHK